MKTTDFEALRKEAQERMAQELEKINQMEAEAIQKIAAPFATKLANVIDEEAKKMAAEDREKIADFKMSKTEMRRHASEFIRRIIEAGGSQKEATEANTGTPPAAN